MAQNQQMLLAVDIGNTNIVIGGFAGDKLAFEIRLKTDSARTPDEYDATVSSLVERKVDAKAKFRAAVISSVVPPMTPTFIQLARERFA